MAINRTDPTIINRPPDQGPETLVYNDNESALVWREPGQVVNFPKQKYLNALYMPGNAPESAIVTMDGTSTVFVFGSGVALMLTEMPPGPNGEKRYSSDEKNVAVAVIDEIAPDNLPKAVIGEPWSLLEDKGGDTGPIKSVIAQYKTVPVDHKGPRKNSPSPFPEVNKLLMKYSKVMQNKGQL